MQPPKKYQDHPKGCTCQKGPELQAPFFKDSTSSNGAQSRASKKVPRPPQKAAPAKKAAPDKKAAPAKKAENPKD